MEGKFVAFPTRLKPSWRYWPWIAFPCMCMMLIGIGIWVHYTSLIFVSITNARNVMQLDYTTGSAMITRVKDSLSGTSVVYCIFASCVLALCTLKGYVESVQDLEGQVYQHMEWLIFSNMLLQFAWGVIMFWLVIMGMGDALLFGFLGITQSGLAKAINLQLAMPPQIQGIKSLTYDQYTCPAFCFDANAYSFLMVYALGDTVKPGYCVCDLSTLQSSYAYINQGYNGGAGLIAGLVIMYIFGIMLSHHMTGMFAQIRTWLDMNERLHGIAK